MKKQRWIVGVSLAAVLALVATLAVLWPGVDARELPVDNASVWVLQTGDGKRYARVNSDLNELDIVRDIQNPSGVAQHGENAVLFTDGHQRYARVNPVSPKHLTEGDDEEFEQVPAETQLFDTAGEWIAYLTASGEAFIGTLGAPAVKLAPQGASSAEQEDPGQVVTALGVSPDGEVALVHGAEGLVRVVTAHADEGGAEWRLPESLSDSVQVASVAGVWFVLDEERGRLWQQDIDTPIVTGLSPGAVLQYSSETGNSVLVADPGGLTRAEFSGTEVTRVSEASGTPARPLSVGGESYAAWVSETRGDLWSSREGQVQLDFLGERLAEEQQPVFASNGSRVVLNEQRTGWVWSVPDGALMPSSLQWTLDEQTPQMTDNRKPERVLDPKPPVAEPDEFGVRAGRTTTLPVLLNDHDPNEDVLTIIPGSLTQPESEFGEVSIVNNEQQLVITVPEGASGSTSFKYAVTDGTQAGGLNSEPTTVQITVVDESTNTAPEWCGADNCLSEWPEISVVPGGTQTVNVLEGWVDREGDPIVLRGITAAPEVGEVITTPDGRVTYRHPDPSQTEAQSFALELIVADVLGAETQRTLMVTISEEPQLVLIPFGVTGATGEPIELDVTPQVRGARGPAELTALSLLSEQTTPVSLTRNGLTATLKAQEPGTYVLKATVADGVSETTEIIRVTVIDPADATITTAPLTAFVRPGEDATVDVLPAVSDPAGAVLLLSDVEVTPEDDTELTVDLIGQRYLRITGDTASGEAGVLGRATYRVSDGSDAPTRTAVGEVTFILLPPFEATAPIASDDRVTVRAGQQVDIAVLANDTAPTGAQIHIDPSALMNEHQAGLAFATHDTVRYLAPDEPGDYTLSYRTFLLGYPSLTSTARVHITVTGDETNNAPHAPQLVGRVLAGQSVSIPFKLNDTDADGDTLMLDRITEQPDEGLASISPEGDAIVFESAPGASGQTQFSYQVTDQHGATDVGTVRIGVLKDTADPRPVAYSDYVQVQAGENNSVVIAPLDNDIDPGGSQLTLVDVTPNAVPGTSEYVDLAAKLQHVDTENGLVTVVGGHDLGTSSYEYTVTNDRGDVVQGLIVVKVVREYVPTYPRVADTTLTSETIDQLSEGVDVLSGRVTWTGGDAAALSLKLWGEQPGFTSRGSTIAGVQTESAQIIPFEVSGESYSGKEAVTYGFLRVPGSDSVTLRLRSDYQLIEVNENERVDVNLADAVAVPAGETLEVNPDGVRASGARAEAVCSVSAGLTLRYEAGAGAPWQDSCAIPVKLASQEETTLLTMKVRIIAEDPRPELRPGTLTVSPGETLTYQLDNMIEWNHRTARPEVTFATEYSGKLFEVTQQGATLSIRALDTAKPSRSESVTVNLSSEQGATPAQLSLTVGRSPQTLPKGASVAAECSQAGGASSCLVTVVGAAGEVNPLPGTPLTLHSVSTSQRCEGVTMSVENDTQVRVNWRDDLAGIADCRATFSLTDAQGRTTQGDRVGQLMFDLQGLPANPTRLDWVAFDRTQVTLAPVSDRASIPAVTHYTVTGGGTTVTCQVDRECVISGLEQGAQTQFTATAVNAVGTSRGSASVTAWGYSPPRAPKLQSGWQPVPNGAEGGVISFTLSDIDPSTASVSLQHPSSDGTYGPKTSIPVNGNTLDVRYSVGTNTATSVRVTPETRHATPPISNGPTDKKRLTLTGVHGVGAPALNITAVPDTRAQEIAVQLTSTPNGTDDTLYGFQLVEKNGTAQCSPQRGNSSHTFTGVDVDAEFTVVACATHRFRGETGFGTTTVHANVTFETPKLQPATYTVGADPSEVAAGVWAWQGLTTTAVAAEGYELQFMLGDRRAPTLAELMPEPGVTLEGTFTVRQCLPNGKGCSPAVALTPTGAVSSPLVTFESLSTGEGFCAAGDLERFVQVDGLARAEYAVQLHEDSDQQVRYLEVTFVDRLGLERVRSASCAIEPPPPPPDPELPDPELPDPEAPEPPQSGSELFHPAVTQSTERNGS